MEEIIKKEINECDMCGYITELNFAEANGFGSIDRNLCDICYSSHLGLVGKYNRENIDDVIIYIAKSFGYLTNILIECIGRDKLKEVLKNNSDKFQSL